MLRHARASAREGYNFSCGRKLAQTRVRNGRHPQRVGVTPGAPHAPHPDLWGLVEWATNHPLIRLALTRIMRRLSP